VVVATRGELIAFLDDLLEPGAFEDYGPNGLQVPGAEVVELVATGVSAGLELFRRAAQDGAQLVLCHHGILWDFHPRAVSPQMKDRLQALFAANMSLAAYHLPLDAHPEHGNNALICEALGLERGEPFGPTRPAPGAEPRPIGFVGRSAEGVAVADLLARCRETFGQEPLAWLDGPDPVHALGIVSGAAASSLGSAVERGLDVLLTGEPAEHTMADAREGGVHFLACGHYATETLGVRRLGDLLAERFGVGHHFVEVPNPI
jgi:dinuclear metal center YbgI/SA1388 family protein